MNTQNFSAKNFAFLTRRGDYQEYFNDNQGKDNEVIKKGVLRDVENNLDVKNYAFQPLHSFNINKRRIYSLPRILKDNSNRFSIISDDYILRKINQNLRKIYKVKQGDRFQIISSVKTLLANPAPFYVCQLDIKSFYENIDRQKILTNIESSAMVSYQTKILLKKFFSNPSILNELPEKGLPRGINISATLAEYCMKNFDKKVSGIEWFYYYARFVDDIIIFSTREITNQVIEEITRHLPTGLEFNVAKKVICDFSEDIDVCISYLGYEFKCSKSVNERKISTRIAKKKMNKIKGKIVSSFLSYKSCQDFKLLKDRLLFLTASYPLKQRKFSNYKDAGFLHGGIFYNYPLIDDLSCLSELDMFLKGLLFSKSMRKRIGNILTDIQRTELGKFSFLQGYERRIVRRFKLDRIDRITECWR